MITFLSGLLVCAGLLYLVVGFIPVTWLPIAQLLPATSWLLLIASIFLLALSWLLSSAKQPALIATIVTGSLLVFQYGAPHLQWSEPSDSNSTVRMLTLNVQQFQNDTQHVSQVINLLSHYDADIVFLQEFGLYYKWPDIAAVSTDFSNRTSYPYYDFTPLEGNIFGTACFSKFPIQRVDTIFQLLSNTNEAKAYDIDLGGYTLHVINAHLMSYNLNGKADPEDLSLSSCVVMRQEQLEALLKLPQDLMVGDFNSVPGDRLYHTIVGHYRDVFNGFLQPTHRLIPVRIDHVFASDRFVADHVEIIGEFPGDHRALLVDFSLTN